jgi:hypothetical protein
MVFLKKRFFYIVLIVFITSSCKKEEEVEIIPPRDVGEQAIQDEQSLEDFLSNHFYNYEEFKNLDNQTKILFDTISGVNSDKIPLIDQVIKSTISVKTSDESFVSHPIYTLVAREGTGQSPSSVDSTYVSYEGLLLNKSSFDRSLTPIWFDLTSVVRGFREGMPALKPGDFSVDENNVPIFSNFGQGAIFMPSGLAYFGNATGSIPAYSPIIFKLDLFLVKQTDHDGDGILSALEFDNDGDGIADDTDGDGLADYLDAD